MSQIILKCQNMALLNVKKCQNFNQKCQKYSFTKFRESVHRILGGDG